MTTRRDFLRKVAAGAAGAAAASCTRTDPGRLIPYLVAPEDVVPGEAVWYATLCRECPAGCGTLARVREGRVVKLEGNPDHPLNRGALCPRGQAALQGLYNPDRIRGPETRVDGITQPLDWETALAALTEALQGARVAWIGHHVTGALDGLIDEFLAARPGSGRVRFEALAYEPVVAAHRILFGAPVVPSYDLTPASYILSFGADFLETWLSNVSLARQYGAAHSVRQPPKAVHVHASPRRGLTGENADRWLAVEPGSEALVAAALVGAVLQRGAGDLDETERERLLRVVENVDLPTAAASAGVSGAALERVAEELAAAATPVVLGGGAAALSERATALEVAVAMLNYICGAIGTTVRTDRPAAVGDLAPFSDVLELVAELAAGRYDVLFVHHANPAFALPPAAGFAAALEAVDTVVSFGSYPDETLQLADLVLPDHTPLESWGDHEPVPGMQGLQQPVQQPLHDTRATGDVLLQLMAAETGSPSTDFATYLRDLMGRESRGAPRPSGSWEDGLRRGGWFAAEENRAEAAPPRPQLAAELTVPEFGSAALSGGDDDLPLIIYPTLQLFDGRGANRPWLQELPDPVTKATWGSWIEIHPETAAQLGVSSGDQAQLSTAQGTLEGGVLVTPTLRPGCLAVPLGQGHRRYGRYAAGRGVDPASLLPPTAEAASGGFQRLSVRARLQATGRRQAVARTQTDDSDRGRGIARSTTVSALQDGAIEATPAIAEATGKAVFYGLHEHAEHRWGMSIDLDACIGCGACEVACAAENNVPVVGPEAIARGREMSWIRIERFRDAQATTFVPMLCQHCDNAPCETVCPVYATYHNDEGLNAMVYNRCVGTRYCANNCPYKVRRFNWLEPQWPAPLDLQLNPDVTPRSRGVMEKCTFCVQRIQAGKQRAAAQERGVADGEIMPACAQTCPVEAIHFGDLEDPGSRVSVTSRDPRGYHVLEELNTKPAITYLRRVFQEPA